MIRLVIDTDPGVDDALAIMAAFAHPKALVEAITTVAGNVSLERTTANACTILDVLEQNVPVYAGCNCPLVGDAVDAGHIHGEDGLGDSGYPPSARQVADEHAVNALIRLANEWPGELTLVAIGPLTNVALATRLDPMLPQKYARLVVMGGSIRGVGNVTTAAEFNVYADPEAAAVARPVGNGSGTGARHRAQGRDALRPGRAGRETHARSYHGRLVGPHRAGTQREPGPGDGYRAAVGAIASCRAVAAKRRKSRIYGMKG